MTDNEAMSKIIDGYMYCSDCDFKEALHNFIMVANENFICLTENGRVVVRDCPKCGSELHYPMNDVPKIGDKRTEST